MKLPRLKKILLPIVLPLALLAGQAQAAYNLRYTTIAPGAVTFTGNTIGLGKGNNTNNPGTQQAIGAYIAEGQGASTYSGHPAPTTNDWTKNRSFANLVIPAGATVLYAELIWGGSYSYGSQFRTLAERNGAVTMITPNGSNSIAPDSATAANLGTIGGSGGTCTSSSPPCFYVRSANVTSQIAALGAGTHRIDVGAIPATIGSSENNLNTGGWTLAVAYKDTSMAEHKMNIYVGAEFIASGGTAAPAAVSGFCTAPSGTQSGRLMASAMEGDPSITNDSFLFGATNPPPAGNKLSGPRNPVNNFFASQITDNDGNLNTTGSFGSLNSSAGATVSGARQGWDIVNVSLDAFLAANQTSAYAQPITNQDTYMVNALGIQIKVGQPSFPTAVKTVDKTTAKVGDELLYTVTLDNTTGTASATNVKFFDTIPAGLTFVPGSFTSAGSPVAGADPTSSSGVTLANIATAAKLVVTFKVKVTSVPARPAPASYVNAARWTYDYIPCAGQPTISSEKITNSVTTTIARLDMAKTVSPTGTQNAGSTLTYTITMKNDGLAASSGTTLLDTIPAGATYVAGSTKINGTAVADVAGAMPFATAAAISSASQSAGVIAVGASATVEFKVTINGNATGNITNSATGDIDGSGTGTEVPFTTPPVSNTVQPVANVSITKTNGVSSVASGSSTSYTIQISNTGPSPANNTVVQDPVATGLNCTAVTCPAADLTGGAVCPASLDIPTLQGTGLTIPTLPANATIKLQVACTVTATGV